MNRNENAATVGQNDVPFPIAPDHAFVPMAIRKHREGKRRPVAIPVDDPFTEVSP